MESPGLEINVFSDGSLSVMDVLDPPPPEDFLKAYIKPDPLLPSWHEYWPVRASAPAPCVFDTFYPYAIHITEPWQILIGDCLSYSRYGASFIDIGGRKSAEGQRIIQAFVHLLSTKLAFANGDAGYGGTTPKINVLSGETGQGYEWPRFEKVRVTGTVTFAAERYGSDIILKSFVWEDGPPPYDISILEDYRIFEPTQIYRAGGVRVFPGLDAYRQYLPLISRASEPIVYDGRLADLYFGKRIPTYYSPPSLISEIGNFAGWAANFFF